MMHLFWLIIFPCTSISVKKRSKHEWETEEDTIYKSPQKLRKEKIYHLKIEKQKNERIVFER